MSVSRAVWAVNPSKLFISYLTVFVLSLISLWDGKKAFAPRGLHRIIQTQCVMSLDAQSRLKR